MLACNNYCIRVSFRLKKGQGATNRKRAILGLLRAHFSFLNAILNLKVWTFH